jgi:diguanylate cyclase
LPSSKRATLHAGLVWAIWLVLAAYITGLVLHSTGLGPQWQGWFRNVVHYWLAMLTSWLPVAVCWMAVWRVGFRRLEVLLAAMAMTAYATGYIFVVWAQVTTGLVPFPSVGDGVYLLFFPFMVAALFVTVRRHVRPLGRSVWLDCAVGSLGAAAVLVVVLGPVLDSALTGAPSLATVVALAYPILDLLLVATVAGIAALGDVRLGNRWGLLIAGLLVFAATDVVYALQVTAGTFVVGMPLDAGWAVGPALVAMWVDGATRRDQPVVQEARPSTGGMALTVSTVATVAGLGVLVVGTQVHVPKLAVVLATVTLLAAAARSQMAFRLLARMANLRRMDAATDELTGLPNRRALYAEGQARLAGSQCRRHALLMLDLNKFKEVNDSLGHQTGDQLLAQVATRLHGHLREGDLLARLGGDEFAMLLDDTSHDEAVEVADRLRAALDEPFALDGVTLYSRVSIGIAMFPDDTDDGPSLSTMLRKADIAMYRAKTSRAGRYVYSGNDEAEGEDRLRTVEELRAAMTSDQLVLHYQPKVDLATGAVNHVEALVRWNNPTRGLLYPGAFVGPVEESGLMPSLTRVVLALVLDQIADWQNRGRWLTVAVNLPASSLGDSDLPRQVASMLAARGVSPGALQLEITEEFLMADPERARDILTRLRDGGVQISIGDFGTGNSSLSFLRDLPIDELKLDRSLINPIAEDTRAAENVASSIHLAHSLGLRVVAQGVESEVALTRLKRLGCDLAQGFFISRPVPADELDRWLSRLPPGDQSTDIPWPLRTVAMG